MEVIILIIMLIMDVMFLIECHGFIKEKTALKNLEQSLQMNLRKIQ